ncbi:MAG: sporulation protein YabP [Oscillospiraceae bacterium]|jgi:sporulation protein YabP|nr:sporulation protein YabP [Oscillospiraceae bacterium]
MEKQHNLILNGRNRLMVSGVNDVASFDEHGVTCETSEGTLVIRGVGLKVDKLSIEGGELTVEGKIDSMVYEEARPQGGFFSRLFR